MTLFLNLILVLLMLYLGYFMLFKIPRIKAKAKQRYLHRITIEALVFNPYKRKNQKHTFYLDKKFSCRYTLAELMHQGHILTTVNGTNYVKISEYEYCAVHKFLNINVFCEDTRKILNYA